MIYRFKLQARSIDGTVYSTGFGSWTSDKAKAPGMPIEECMRIIEDQRIVNKDIEPDAAIGRFALLPLLAD